MVSWAMWCSNFLLKDLKVTSWYISHTCRIVLDDQYQALLMLGLMWWNVFLMTITRLFSECLDWNASLALEIWFKLFYIFQMTSCIIFKMCTLCRRTTKVSRCLNLGSYNYLGFAAADEYCTPRVTETLQRYSASTCSTRMEGGNFNLFLQFSLYNFIPLELLLMLLTFNFSGSFRHYSTTCWVGTSGSWFCWKTSCYGYWHGLCYQLCYTSCIN